MKTLPWIDYFKSCFMVVPYSLTAFFFGWYGLAIMVAIASWFTLFLFAASLWLVNFSLKPPSAFGPRDKTALDVMVTAIQERGVMTRCQLALSLPISFVCFLALAHENFNISLFVCICVALYAHALQILARMRG